MKRLANSESVAIGWLGRLFNPQMVGAQLPEDNSSWASSGFITVTVFGGHSNIYVPFHFPVLGIKCWTNAPNTGRPPWNKAFNLAQNIEEASYSIDQTPFTIPYCDQSARVSTVNVFETPRRNYGDTGDYACVDMNIIVNWTIA